MTMDELLEQTQWDLFWAPDEMTVLDRPELLLLSHPQDLLGFNAIHRLRAPDTALQGLLQEAIQHHANRRSRAQLYPSNNHPVLQRALEDAGYHLLHKHTASTLATNAPRPPVPDDLVVRPLNSIPRMRDAIRVNSQAFGNNNPLPAMPVLQEYLAACTAPGCRVHRFVVYDRHTNTPLSSGGLTVFPSLSFGFLWGGGTIVEGRGRGAYTALVSARQQRAAEQGIELIGLYARVDTSAPILMQQGFTTHGRMDHWLRPA